jgi:hypothetical protein
MKRFWVDLQGERWGKKQKLTSTCLKGADNVSFIVRIRETEGEMGDRVLVSSLSTEEYITTAFMVRVAEGISLLLCPSKIFRLGN